MSEGAIDRTLAAIPATLKLRVLIVRIGAMGDVLHAMPAVAALRAALPDCFIGWAVEPRWIPLLRAADGTMPLVDRVHAVKTREWKRRPLSPATWGEMAGLRRELHAERYDICFDLQGSIKSAVVGWMAGAKGFLGPDLPREMEARMFYTDRIGVTEWNVIGQACEVVSAGIGKIVEPGRVEFPVDAGAEIWCDALADARGRFVMIAPTAGWGAKEWGAERYGALAAGLLAKGLRVLVNEAPGAPQGIAGEVASISGATVVSSTISQMIALTRRAGLVIGGDTGPVHLAAALGRPVVALFGPTDPDRNGPAFVGARVTVLRDDSSVTNHKRRSETEAGLARIRVEEVLAVALAMLEGE